MYLVAAIILVLLWGVGFAFRILGGLIHIVLVLAVISAIIHFITGTKKV